MTNRISKRFPPRDVLCQRAAALGYSVSFVDRSIAADHLRPMAIPAAGLCDKVRREIIVATAGRGEREILAILSHEIEHAAGAEVATDYPEFGLRCGGTRTGVAYLQRTTTKGGTRKMVSHPNRKPGERKPGSNPTPEQVRQFRRDTGLSLAGCAALVHASARAWLQWETEPHPETYRGKKADGARRMHAAFWELALIKAGRHVEYVKREAPCD